MTLPFREQPFKDWCVTYPLHNGQYVFSYKEGEGLEVSMFSAHAGSASITLHEIDEKISFEVLAHFFKKLALARGECLEKDLTSSDHNIRASALTIQEMITAIDKLVIPTEAELKAFRGY